VELVFAARAMWEGLRLARPWGESSGYDFVVIRSAGGLGAGAGEVDDI